MPRPGNSDDEKTARELGLDFITRTISWTEPGKDRYAWVNTGGKELKPGHLAELKRQGYKISLTYTNVHMNKKHLPAYLKGKRFNDPYLLERWEKHLVAFLSRYGDHIDFLNIGNEVNNYFRKHENEWSDYVEFVKRSAQIVRKHKPKIKIGVVLVEKERERFWRDIEGVCDYFAFTYYTPGSVFGKSPTSEALDSKHPKYFAKTLDRALALAGDKQALITEIGCATHEALESSPELQAQFITGLFEWMKGKEGKIIGISWLSLTDWPYEGTKQHLKNQLGPALLEYEPFMRFLTSLGLKYEDGSPKVGYDAFKTQALRFRNTR